MAKRLALFGLLAGGGALAWIFSRSGIGAGVYAPPGPLDPAADPATLDPAAGGVDVASYLPALSQAEDPTQNPWAKNPYSSASGLFQFTKGTWTGLGGDWGPDPTQAFGGLKPSVDEQYAMAARLSASNAGLLDRLGVGVSNSTLYAAHILGPGRTASALPGILAADPSTPLAAFIPQSILAINKALGATVGSFLGYLGAKVGG